MAKSYCNLLYHIVFSTKGREPWLEGDILARCHEYLGGAIRSEGGVALIVNGTTDHVHILAKLRQDKAVADVVRGVKANSSGWFHRTFRRSAFAWQAGYGAFTVSFSRLDLTRAYIEGQATHHRRFDFKREYVALLEKNGIEYDERSLWD
ncbi:MAG TPA: transposase [Planctomycetota bacterium]|nr:transposase [Planctomycetota bacterium]